MLYHSRYTAETEVYFMQWSCRLEGDLDPAAFERAWQQVVDRHTALRASFHWRELERPLQVVSRRVTVPFVVEDWRALSPGEQAERFERLLVDDRKRGFELERPPLLRLTLCRMADSPDTRYQLVWSFHHLLFDGWSMPLVLEEVFAFYAAARRGEELDLPRPRPYRDFILWLKRQDLAAAEAFWRQALAGFTAPTPLVLGAAPAEAPEGDGMGRVYLPVRGALFAGLQELGRRRRLTLSTLVQGAWALLLARSSGEEDVVFGVTSAGRPADLPGSGQMVGVFINTLPARVRVPLDEPLLPWLQELQLSELRMREHEHSPLVRIQEWSDVPRGVPLFSSLVVFEGFAVEGVLGSDGASERTNDPANLAIGEVRHVQKTNFPLALNASPQGDWLRLRLSYDRSRFATPDALRALGHLEVLLLAIVENPERRLADLPLLTAAERHQLEVEWNAKWNAAPRRASPAAATLTARLAAQAARTPDAVAVVFGEARLTYGDLAARAARVGRRLRAGGARPGDRVGLSLDRSPELVVGLLGILAVGGTYVPIDPGYPEERQAFLRQDAGLAALVDRETLVAGVAEDHPPPSLPPSPPTTPPRGEEPFAGRSRGEERQPVLRSSFLDGPEESFVEGPRGEERQPALRSSFLEGREEPFVERGLRTGTAACSASLPPGRGAGGDGGRTGGGWNCDEPFLPRTAGFDAPLYAIYTSGSTGRPKGAVVRERAFVDLVDWYVGELGMGAADRLLLISSASFDLTQKNFFAPLLLGAELHLAPVAYDPGALRAHVERHGITRLNCTPSAFYPLAEEGDPAALASLRSVVLGGEPIAAVRLDRWRRSANCRAVVINSYGPTECTDVVAYHRLAGPAGPETGVPLGRPIPGVRLWIGGHVGEPAPIGVPGELWIGGDCVGGGYLGDPARTAERFLPDPRGETPGARVYRTGDLARRLPDGEIDSLGRIDHQVKVRGFRIEPGEIEAALRAHPALREAVVVARDERLVAYVVARDGAAAAPTDSELRGFLAARLPEPMLPALFVNLPAVPLTPSGKVDRRALPDPERPARPTRPNRLETLPASDLEVYLAGLFRAVLKLPADASVSTEDDFFALGGHSIAAAVLINRLQEKLGTILYAVALFDAPTVSRLAAYLLANDPEAVARVFGAAALAALGGAAPLAPPPARKIDRGKIAAFRRAIAPLPPLPALPELAERNRPAVFVLSPPRSGSTLLRVMLAGHPRLFAPPELELLSFNTLAERRAAFPGRNAFWLEGTVRAVMEVRRTSAEDAEAELGRFERAGMTTGELYRQLQEWIGDRILVDKSPSYALDGAVLERAEETFADARYLHLLRHPYGMISSFEEAKLEEVFFRHPHAFSRRELAELIWLVSQENILAFLAGVPRERQMRVHFEDLLAHPAPVLEEVCAFLGLDFHPEMALPYEKRGGEAPGAGRMTDGIHPWSRMLGDVKFLQHRDVDPAVAERWRDRLHDLVPGDATVALAETLGYPCPALRPASRPPRSPLVPLVPPAEAGPGRPLFLIHPAGGHVFCYLDLARRLGPDRPVYGLATPPLAAGERAPGLEERAAVYVEAIVSVQPRGPYALGAWSLGGVFAWEVAQQLRQRGEDVALLALLDSQAPDPAAPSRDQADLLAALAEELEASSGQTLAITAPALRELPEPARVKTVFAAARRAGAIPADVGEEAALEHLRALEANVSATRAYRPRPYAGRVLLVQAARRGGESAALGWNALAVGGLEIAPFATDHYRLLSEPTLGALVSLLRERLAETP
jgi:amino acid adenylation domain-containing protein